MVVHVKPYVTGRHGQASCPTCGFENQLAVRWVEHNPAEQKSHGMSGFWIAEWDDPSSANCQHLLKYIVEKELMIYADDWELTAIEMGAGMFTFPYIEGVPEDHLLTQLRKLLEWRETNPNDYNAWLRRLRG